ncbi:malate synthase [Streptomyces sp. I05A-00742]|uniref:malate synthase n=1 Tax=Streptomyces sp. I05A-00742 TaxID=2732853 RepID=UPI0014890271|nr:malate synthase [Streptomyces sp. I05A-00742]
MASPALSSPRRARALSVLGDRTARFDGILTPAALDFVARLDEAFAARRSALLAERRHRAALLVRGGALDFVPATTAVRADRSWRVAPPAPGLTDRRTELTGPPDRLTANEALASGARVWTADFADATAPTWQNVIDGHRTLLTFTEELAGPGGSTAPTLVVRPRGWHLTEKHLLIDGRAVPASLVDFGLYFFHCARRQTDAGRGPYFSLPHLENHLEARLWNDVFVLAQDLLGIPRGTVRATVTVETVTAAFEMEEILHELREHAAGLTADHRGYLCSVVKTFPHRRDHVLPDRAKITVTAPFLRAYTELLVRTCHRRGAHAIGGTAFHVPGHDPQADEAALARIRLDAEREAEDGFDGTRAAHPGLVPVCRTVFDAVLGDRPHQLERTREDVHVTAPDLLAVHRTSGRPTEQGVRAGIATALRCLDSWLRGSGRVVHHGRLEDAATSELARCQLWQWLHHGVVRRAAVLRLLDEESAALAAEHPHARWADARDVLVRAALQEELSAFFVTDAYARYLVRRG